MTNRPDEFFDLLADYLAPRIAVRLGLDGPAEPDQRTSRQSRQAPPADDFPPDPDEDPWATEDDQPQRGRSQQRSAPPQRGSGRSSAGGRGNGGRQSGASRGGRGGSSGGGRQDWPDHGTHLDRFENSWTFGEPDAPECKHGHQAALKEGVSQNGNEYSAWTCPLGFTSDYKKACKFFEYTDN